MSVLTRLSRLFGGSHDDARARRLARMRSDGPVVIDAPGAGVAGGALDGGGGDEAGVAARGDRVQTADEAVHEDAQAEAELERATMPAAPRNKQELLAELRKNYAEAVGLIRKMDQHLDEQGRRSGRMVELGERLPEAVEHLAALRSQQGELIEAARQVRETLREGSVRDGAQLERHRELLERQSASLIRIERYFEEQARVERELGSALGEFRGALAHMHASNHRLAGALERLDEREQRHEETLRELSERSRVVTNALILLCGIAVATALVSTIAVLYLATR